MADVSTDLTTAERVSDELTVTENCVVQVFVTAINSTFADSFSGVVNIKPTGDTSNTYSVKFVPNIGGSVQCITGDKVTVKLTGADAIPDGARVHIREVI